ncbi:hypothetical protein Q6322_30205, partial [Klebsiella pneumoniae]|uniref:hypothetical protein n=1 Tax=Klebsiella pneumoniae TaxID=573 RepID=UPI00272F0F9B
GTEINKKSVNHTRGLCSKPHSPTRPRQVFFDLLQPNKRRQGKKKMKELRERKVLPPEFPRAFSFDRDNLDGEAWREYEYR